MSSKKKLVKWVKEALQHKNGSASILEVSKYIWDHYESELRNSDELFYTWQYDFRWAATELRKEGIIRSAESSPKGIWELKNSK